MSSTLEGLLRELERFGAANDAATNERARRMLNVTRDTGEFLAVLVRATLARRVLERAADGAFDLVFLDSERTEYPGWWPQLRRVLRPGGVLVVDNATSPAGAAKELAPFMALVAADGDFTTSLVPVGNGEFFAVKALDAASFTGA